MVYVGSARIDEHGNLSGGASGDQKQTTKPDYKGEVSQQPFYVHKKGWYVLRPKDRKIANAIGDAMIRACNNPNIGYDQGNRLGIIKFGTSASVPTECDCSSLVRECIKEASGKDVGNFNTANEKSVLLKSGLFNSYIYSSGMKLLKGDVLVTMSKGHTVVVTSGDQETTTKRPTIREGSKGADVLYLNKQLKKLGYGVNANSNYFDATTRICVINLQATHDLEPDGIVGKLTWQVVENIK